MNTYTLYLHVLYNENNNAVEFKNCDPLGLEPIEAQELASISINFTLMNYNSVLIPTYNVLEILLNHIRKFLRITLVCVHFVQ